MISAASAPSTPRSSHLPTRPFGPTWGGAKKRAGSAPTSTAWLPGGTLQFGQRQAPSAQADERGAGDARSMAGEATARGRGGCALGRPGPNAAAVMGTQSAMFIETEATPNPATLKFLPGQDVMGARGTADFTDGADAARSPLAERLFALPGVARVFLGSDFVTVTKAEEAEWQALRPQVLGAVMAHFVAGHPVLLEDAAAAEEDVDPADAEIVAQIKELLDTRVRPAVAGDGGDIVFRGFRDGVVKLHMQGACAGCPSSRATLRHGVENMLRHYVPEVVGVEQVEA
jgi:Fe-S cluster biogenesis protein NfuA